MVLMLNEVWFILIAVLFVGFLFLEGFDFGVGMAMRFVAKTPGERRVLINTIGPVWDGNEVWLITAGGAMFAAFPHWYATLFSGLYMPLVIMLLLLIGRGVAFEFRSKLEHPKWRDTWDWTIFISSLLNPFLWGVVFAALMAGLPIDSEMNIYASLFDYITPYTLIGAIAITLLCFLHGLFFITLKTTGDLQHRARETAKKVVYAVGIALVAFVVASYFYTDIFEVRGAVLIPIFALIVVAVIFARSFALKSRDGWAFTMTGLTIALTVTSVFVGLFPRVMVSSINHAFDLTIHNAASGPYSLKVMTIVAVTLIPFVLGYQIWSYYVFRKRVKEEEHLEY
ncbi:MULTISPECIES: cytochrome d ubiquinol oxidase subunit II [Clostridia]|uniref:cytochrome d ubiquinol oxidase subunit II n=1 Tax=Clostridia TaxID=186801 RepID=UPI000EA1D152|nr:MULTISPECIES: cytochrome d ubiquinol oxidase subunit II [Clostridia]NBJ71197.1 cytochrome d ubiquinol oxidase subunit II [Roseburia sp. 1XD42-34]RKI75058.1 cytochrome d ubiquinol oxidase subunit II [Clostridium sp. 1xD42-85]